jgi:uncharacterized protein (DUF305 family)
MNFRIKSITGLVFFLTTTIIISCNNQDDPGIKTQSHDQNEAMSMLHSMLDEIDSIHLLSNPGEDFARIMQVHHKWGNRLGKMEVDKGDDETIKGIAQSMIARNEVELIEFQDFLNSHTPTASAQGKTWDEEAKATLKIMHQNADLEILTGDTDHDYAIIIVNHHQSAIDMARSYLRFGSNVNLKSLAERMIGDQAKEVEDLQGWLLQSKNY